MNQWKRLVLFVGLFLFCLPQLAVGKEVDTSEVGIGFATESEQPAPKPIEPKENVIPLTTRQADQPYQGTRAKNLPQTGDQTAGILRAWGVACMIAVFWLFLFKQLREEEDYE